MSDTPALKESPAFMKLCEKIQETKGSTTNLRPTEQLKINCATKHFDALDLGENFSYDVASEYKYEVFG